MWPIAPVAIGTFSAPQTIADTSLRARAGRPAEGTSVMVLLKYGIAALGSGLWAYGLIDQLGSLASIAKYLTISLLMVAVALL